MVVECLRRGGGLRLWQVGEPGKKNGEKLLRSLITATPEWRSSAERRAAAELFDALPGEERVASALRSKTRRAMFAMFAMGRSCGVAERGWLLLLRRSSAMRKANLMALARCWGYKCSLCAAPLPTPLSRIAPLASAALVWTTLPVPRPLAGAGS